ncbi:MAG: branched-chain amino acid ABC transporter permease, partial [Actinobacteria bacterium]|nr:branched-chain amino acid ABC transporter permease [Actinomycetota bacterium]
SGGLWAHYMTFIQPVMFDMNKSTELAATVVFGGLGSITGSIVATIVLVSIPEVFRFFLQWRMVFYGLALVATITLRPEGIMGYQELSWDWLKGLATQGVGLFRRKEASHG